MPLARIARQERHGQFARGKQQRLTGSPTLSWRGEQCRIAAAQKGLLLALTTNQPLSPTKQASRRPLEEGRNQILLRRPLPPNQPLAEEQEPRAAIGGKRQSSGVNH